MLDGGEERREGGVGGRGYVAAELRFVGCPFEIEVIAAGQTGFVDYGAIEDGALEDGDEIGYGGVSGRHQDALRIDGADQSRLVGWSRGAGFEFRAAFGEF